jgi:hypothetical protein
MVLAPMAAKELSGDLLAAYRDATERLRIGREYAVTRVQDAMSATPGWQAAAKAAAAHAVLAASRVETEALVESLFRTYIGAGARNPETVARQVHERFLSGLTAPGLCFFEGSAPEMVSLSPVALKHAAEFESWRDALAAEVPTRFRRALEAHENEVPLLEARRAHQRLRDSRIVFGLLLVTAAMSLCGVSWLDLLRKAVTLF